MSNQLNKNKNKLKEKDEIHAAQENLILAQQVERRRRFQQITDGHRSTKELLEETRQRLDLLEEAREEFLNLHTPREENRLARLGVPREHECGVNSSSGIHFRGRQLQKTLRQGSQLLRPSDSSSPVWETSLPVWEYSPPV